MARKKPKKKKPVKKKERGGLTGKEIERIIEKSAKSNVREISVSGIRLKFGEGSPAKVPAANSKASKTTQPADAAISSKQHKKMDRETLEFMEAEAKEERLALMSIEDPSEYERLIIAGELTDAANTDDEALDSGA